jgi:carbonic anhydrase/acetyltransferase-like protein (isoleucine patch superfamily)
MGADAHREALGFLTVAATEALADQGVRVLDPGSTLISREAKIGAGTVMYPSVIVNADSGSSLVAGERCVLYPGCVLEARAGARIEIGDGVELGPGGVVIRATGTDGRVLLGAEVRLTGGCELTGACELGRGAQMLGAVLARSVCLGGGRGGHRWPRADERGAVLKGAGIADGVVLKQGEVKSCRASFRDAVTERQSTYHPAAR